MKIDVLGTQYAYTETNEREDVSLCGCNGYCDPYEKRIAIDSEAVNEKDQNSTTNGKAHAEYVRRHELVHAFLFESGLRDYAENELIVDWIAWQMPKMIEAFEKVGAL